MFLNRPGRFTIIVEAVDHFGNQTTQIRLPLRVLSTADTAGG
jgi:hypothetical protein